MDIMQAAYKLFEKVGYPQATWNQFHHKWNRKVLNIECL